jgi:hypothetical protein
VAEALRFLRVRRITAVAIGLPALIVAVGIPPLALKRPRTAKCAELFTLQGQAKLRDDSYRPSASGKIDGTDYEQLTNEQLTQLGWNLTTAALANHAASARTS